MSYLDNHHIAPAVTNIINPPAGGLESTQSRTDSISKAYVEHAEDVEKVSEVHDIDTKADHFGTNTEYSKEERTLLRKLDWHIMPIVFCMYFMNKLDQNAIANARLNSFEKDLGLTGNQFNICVSVLYAGYTLIQIPSNMLMATKKVRPSLWMSCWMMAWAIVSASTAAVHNFSGAFVVRFLLGFAEAPFYPGAIYMLSLFYTRREIATRISILYSANIVATACAGLISAATFATLGGVHGLAGWRWLFIILGVVTFGVSIIAIWLLPDHPLTTSWLSPEERELAHLRMERDTVGLQESKGTLIGLKQAAADPKLWLLTLLQTLHLAACGFNSFFPTVVKTLGYSTTITLVITCPPYLVAGAFSVALAWSSGRRNERSIHITLGMIVALVGFIMAAASLNTAVRFISLFLFATGAYSANSIIIGWVAATCGQTPEKKAGALSIMNCIAMASFIYTPYLYPASDSPRYLMAMSANAAFVTGVIICTWTMRFWLQQVNKKLRSGDATARLLYAY
ncbi:MFS transporter [Cryptococcus neoformans AD2-60a]|uniref:MFS transporter n=2 Tax=Cryptococcus neoformans TaxID=5207 RepID=A0A854QAD2_CRYNE|nr:MFS transporter [Cryptococcus neoformans var. grubii H99]AUB27398.1 MFS transporter [Cryptococcus neoformans var. grubii]OWZ28355.1 MFS transporter [Cryptococcus neoformans var. grubii AD2-60a]OWZ34088.1 MFS transporter [Cryptococcus neoformans var. grubii AD1-83a]OXC82515.1 MFS transporter [Cryptococcus neoformans var. grubii AD1-7a]OXG13636.1 MFS transporter [Cryptococcus neoformans var. grubii Tu259-1]OXG35483.1 MFS transporter [Cryptococcus neoformans var. grubii Bt120]OXG51644.1 MFS |eukprot:XP_012052239.1 MFS transporter [Cryptococcus neoformans var. grubii H99]